MAMGSMRLCGFEFSFVSMGVQRIVTVSFGPQVMLHKTYQTGRSENLTFVVYVAESNNILKNI